MKAASIRFATFVFALWPTIALAQIRPQREHVDMAEVGGVLGLFVLGVAAYYLSRWKK